VNGYEERVRAARLTTWIAVASAAILGGAFALAEVAPAGAEGVRAFIGWCGIG
jgi:hypothetical protein